MIALTATADIDRLLKKNCLNERHNEGKNSLLPLQQWLNFSVVCGVLVCYMLYVVFCWLSRVVSCRVSASCSGVSVVVIWYRFFLFFFTILSPLLLQPNTFLFCLLLDFVSGGSCA